MQIRSAAAVFERAKTAIVNGLEKLLGGRDKAEVSFDEFRAAMPVCFPYHPWTPEALDSALTSSRMDLTGSVERLCISRVSAEVIPQHAPIKSQPQTSHKPTAAREEVKTETPVLSKTPVADDHLIREAKALQAECATFGISLTAADALSQLLAERGAKKGASMTIRQLACAAQIAQARLRQSGVFVSTSEALQRVMREHKVSL